MITKVAVDASAAVAAWTKAFQRLRELPGFDHRKVLIAEAGSILKTWAGRTKVATKEQADFRARYRAGKAAFGNVSGISGNPYRISVNTGARGGFPGEVWYRHRMSGKFQQAGVIDDSGRFTPAWIHWKSAAWQGIREGSERYGQELARALPFARKSIGLAQQSIVQIADDLGIDLAAVKGTGISAARVGVARGAVASTGKRFKNGTGLKSGDGSRFEVVFRNHLPFCVKSGMDRTLRGVIAGRAKFIETAYRKGAMDSARNAAKSFPNVIRVISGA
jgi:hypothetical protein